MKKLLRSSLLIGAAALGLGSIGVGGLVAKAATTPAPEQSTAAATLTPGTITLDTVPGAESTGSTTPGISFGTVASSAADATYASTAISSDLHVTNPGEPTGWSVSVADTPFTDSSGGTLKGAQLSFADPDTVSADAKNNVSALPTFSPNISLTSAPVAVLNAPAGDGVGAYTADYAPTSASLFVPAGNVGGSYSSTLSWTLSNAPS